MSRAAEARAMLSHPSVAVTRLHDPTVAALAKHIEHLAAEVDELRGEQEAARVAEREAALRRMLQGGLGT